MIIVVPHARRSSSRNTGLVSQRFIRAALEAVFPTKSAGKQNALRRALHVTLQKLGADSKMPAADRVYVSDLFAQTQDGGQTPLVEEVRRQHYYELLDFAAALGDALSAKYGSLVPDMAALTEVLTEIDVHTTHPGTGTVFTTEDLAHLAVENWQAASGKNQNGAANSLAVPDLQADNASVLPEKRRPSKKTGKGAEKQERPSSARREQENVIREQQVLNYDYYGP